MKTLLLAVLLCTPSASFAGTELGLEAWGGAGFALGDKSWRNGTDVGPDLGARAAAVFDRRWDLGVSYENLHFSRGRRVEPILVSATRYFKACECWTPFIRLGAGVSSSLYERRDVYRHLALRPSVGAEYALSRALALRGELAYLHVNNGGFGGPALNALIPNLGLVWRLFGGEPAKPVAAAPAPAPAPAPKPEPVVVPPPAPAPAPKPSPKQVSVELKVLFDTDKSVVRAEFDGELKRVADFMAQFPKATAEIQGHTDSMGSAAYNTGLSQRRADAVREALSTRFSIAPERLTSKGYGPEKPVADNATEEGRKANRRVVAVIETMTE